MKILMISPTQPLPADNGARIRIYNFARLLSEQNQITFMTLENKRKFEINQSKCQIFDWCHKFYSIPHYRNKTRAAVLWTFSRNPYRRVKSGNKRFSNLIKKEIKEQHYDVIFCNFIEMAYCLDNIKTSKFPNRPLFILDQHNADELWYSKFSRMKSPLLKYFGLENLRRLQKYQNKYYSKFDLCLSVCQEDADITEKLISPDKIMVAPNGVDLEYFSPKVKQDKSANIIVFCGSLDVMMNQDAVYYFSKYIFPKIKELVPDAKFLVVGRNPPKKIKKLCKQKGIIVTGTVSDVRPYYELAVVAVAPFRLGGGTKLKILEAMAMKVPVVSTLVGCQGISVHNGKYLSVAYTDDEFVKSVVDMILRRPRKLVNDAYELVHTHYSWKSIVQKVEKRLGEMYFHNNRISTE